MEPTIQYTAEQNKMKREKEREKKPSKLVVEVVLSSLLFLLLWQYFHCINWSLNVLVSLKIGILIWV